MARLTRHLFVLAVAFALAAGCSGDGDDTGAGPSSTTTPAGGNTTDTTADSGADTPDEVADPLAGVPVLTPTSSFDLIDPDNVQSVAMSPDGVRVAVSYQEEIGMPVTLRLFDSATGEVVATTDVDAYGLSRLYWMADNRIVAPDQDFVPRWRGWDGDTLVALPTLPQDLGCADGQADKNTGAVFSTNPFRGMADTICRFDSTDGSTLRIADGVIVGTERFWVRPATGEVVVLHGPDPDTALELLALDGAALTPVMSTVVEFTQYVEAVGGSTAWIVDQATNRSSLEPGGFPVPNLAPVRPSGAGTIFVSSNGDDDHVFVSGTDGSVIGTMPAGLNPSGYADWSIDDSSFVRVTSDGQAEIYEF